MLPELTKIENSFHPSILTKVEDPLLEQHQLTLLVKRDDLLHPIISGNKWRKLKYIIDHALSVDANTIISMGGAYSNHLHALAYLGKTLQIKTIGIIRGENHQALTPTLMDLQNWGMELKFVSRSEYRLLRQYKSWQDLPGLGARQYWLPEGGAHRLALQGVGELISEINIPFDILCTPCGTGTTLAGLIEAAPESVQAIGFAALKNAGFLTQDVEKLLTRPRPNWYIEQNYHFGGFAKTNNELNDFIEYFSATQHIPLEPVYTGKMLWGIFDLIKKDLINPRQTIVAIHTGGLQGNRGFTSKSEP